MGARLKSVVLIEVASLIKALLSVLQKKLALETGQIVHQYNYYRLSCAESKQKKGITEDGLWRVEDRVYFCWFLFCGISAILGECDNGLVLMEGKHELTSTYVALLDQVLLFSLRSAPFSPEKASATTPTSSSR